MQAFNHTVFGALVAVTIKEPALAIPIALGSHFVMDAIPHYGNDPKAPRGSKFYNMRVLIDGIASILILVIIVSLKPADPGLIIACALFAVLPDLLWPLALHIKQKGPLWDFFKFHKHIQRESRSGIFVEIGWFVLSALFVVYNVRLG